MRRSEPRNRTDCAEAASGLRYQATPISAAPASASNQQQDNDDVRRGICACGSLRHGASIASAGVRSGRWRRCADYNGRTIASRDATRLTVDTRELTALAERSAARAARVHADRDHGRHRDPRRAGGARRAERARRAPTKPASSPRRASSRAITPGVEALPARQSALSDAPSRGSPRWSASPTDPPLPPNWKPGGYLEKLPRDPWGQPVPIHQSRASRATSTSSRYGADGQPGGTGVDADIGSWDL